MFAGTFCAQTLPRTCRQAFNRIEDRVSSSRLERSANSASVKLAAREFRRPLHRHTPGVVARQIPCRSGAPRQCECGFRARGRLARGVGTAGFAGVWPATDARVSAFAATTAASKLPASERVAHFRKGSRARSESTREQAGAILADSTSSLLLLHSLLLFERPGGRRPF